MKSLLVLLIMGGVAGILSAEQAPVWAGSYGFQTSYSSTGYLTGFGMAQVPGKSAEALKSAKEAALAELSGKLKTKIDASSRLTDTEEGRSNYSSYQSDVKTMVSLDLGGVENYEVYFSQDLNTYEALTVMDIGKMKTFLGTGRIDLINGLEADQSALDNLGDRGRKDLMEERLRSFDRHLDGLIQNLAIARLLGDPVDPAAQLAKYYDARKGFQARLISGEILTQKDLVKAVERYFPWSGLSGKTLALETAFYKTSDISGQFFANLRDDLADTLEQEVPGIKVVGPKQGGRSDYVFQGTYQEDTQGGYILKFKLYDSRQGPALTVFETRLDKDFVRAQNQEFIPANFQAAVADHDLQNGVFNHAVKTDLRIRTSVGESGMTVAEGTRFYFWIWVNRTGYISLLYTLAGEKHLRASLEQNYFIAPSQINQWVRFEKEFEVAAPFGVESAQFFFSVNQNPAYQTEKGQVDGVEYDLLTGNYGKMLETTRGLVSPNQSADAEQLRTDRSFTLTTVPKR